VLEPDNPGPVLEIPLTPDPLVDNPTTPVGPEKSIFMNFKQKSDHRTRPRRCSGDKYVTC